MQNISIANKYLRWVDPFCRSYVVLCPKMFLISSKVLSVRTLAACVLGRGIPRPRRALNTTIAYRYTSRLASRLAQFSANVNTPKVNLFEPKGSI